MIINETQENVKRLEEHRPAERKNQFLNHDPVVYSNTWFNYVAGSFGRFLGLHQVTAIEIETKKNSDILLSIRSAPPLPLLNRSIEVACIYRRSTKSLTIPRIFCRLEQSRLVPDDSPFLKACQAGRFLDVQDYLLSGQATLDDVDSNNMTPLLVSGLQLYHN
jgi:hypothetical protein